MNSDEDATIRRLARAGHSDVEIAQRLGLKGDAGRQHVGRRRRALRLQPGLSPALQPVIARLRGGRRYIAIQLALIRRGLTSP